MPPTQTLQCQGAYQLCRCNQLQPCVIECEGKDSCSDSTLICPMKHHCAVHCPHDAACKKAQIEAPRAADFVMICDGDSSCSDSKIAAERARDVALYCGGKDSCKGAATEIHCGSGLCTLSFLGEAAGDSATIRIGDAAGFHCDGRYAPCPDNFTPPCPAAERAECAAPRFYDEMSCECRCPENPDGLRVCGGPFQVFSLETCRCELRCPGYAPTEAECAAFGMLWSECSCHLATPSLPAPDRPAAAPSEAANCCLANPAQPEPVQWAGTCWPKSSEAECAAVPNYRCLWNPWQCLPDPPVNSIDPATPCKFENERCGSFSECCSEICKSDGRCR